jgi:hypothetical protein
LLRIPLHLLRAPAFSQTSQRSTKNPQGKTLAFVLGIPCRPERTLFLSLILPRYLLAIVSLFSAAPTLSAEVTLAWDPNQETDLEGYRVYFRLEAHSGRKQDHFGKDVDDAFQRP